jgi:hypothetical protein
VLVFVFAKETVTKEKLKLCQRNVIKVRADSVREHVTTASLVQKHLA